jgi:hypothetical protein
MDRDTLASRLELPWRTLRPEVDYLVDRREVEVLKTPVNTRTYYSYRITSAGQDRLEGRDPVPPAPQSTQFTFQNVTFQGTTAFGDNAQAISHHTEAPRTTHQTVVTLHPQLAALRDQVEEHAPPEVRVEAVRRVDQLGAELAAKEPSVERAETLRDWLLEHIPGIAGTTIGTLVHPIVGAIAEAAGKRATDALRRPPADASDPQ